MKNEWLKRRQLKLQTNSNVSFLFCDGLGGIYQVTVQDLANLSFFAATSGVWITSESPHFKSFISTAKLGVVFSSSAVISVFVKDILTGIDHLVESSILIDPMMVVVGSRVNPHATEYIMALDCLNKSQIKSKYFTIK